MRKSNQTKIESCLKAELDRKYSPLCDSFGLGYKQILS